MKKSSEVEQLLTDVESRAEIRSILNLGKDGWIREIAGPAQPFIAALVTRQIPGRLWFVCQNVRRQEEFAAEIAPWCPRTRLFPELEIPSDDALPDPETTSERFDLLRRLTQEGNEVIIVHKGQWNGYVPSRSSLSRDVFPIRTGQRIAIENITRRLLEAGYEPAPQVTARGQFAQRGGILDIFSWQQPRPIRVEWMDVEVESLREFDIDSQVSVSPVRECEILITRGNESGETLRDYLREGDTVIEIDPEEAATERNVITSEVGPPAENRTLTVPFYPSPFADLNAGDLILNEAKRSRFFDQLRRWADDGWKIVFACNNEGERERFRELATDFHFDAACLHFVAVSVTRGFICPAIQFSLLADAEVLGRSTSQRAHAAALRRERWRSRRAPIDFSEFEEGDFVVHLDHGIGRYLGLQQAPDTGGEVLVLEFANEARLYVPLDQGWQVTRYVGLGKKHPDLSELGSGRWQKAKEKARQGIYHYAAAMLRVQAERETGKGYSFPPDLHWQQEFEQSFLFTETEDQLRSIREAKMDMESCRPMDRLICGDVGFGKTEVAIRAAFKAVMSGKQVAVITPTTVLAQQHFQTFRERMSEYPVTIELLSRYRSPGEQRRIVKALGEGGVDIVIGTHRVLSSDVLFRDLGLVVVDEEQRFGVRHKEALKEKFRLIDVLTLSATPIPRTLYLSLMGARDMSLIETPPPNRQPVETIVCGYDERIIRDAIQHELARGGQVYFLHNRVQTIERTAARIRDLCSGVRVIVGHGQMEEKTLETVMQTFVEGKADVLVSTTIIESGLDIPNANTIIIDRADRFGLADLYQLRGRVGRSSNKAYAYLLLPRELMSTGGARKRVSAIKQYSELGSGFKIAMRDLEIRGAGNLLGTEQSGHIVAVGFDLYCKLLRRAVESLKGRKFTGSISTLRLDFLRTNETEFSLNDDVAGAFLPASYLPDAHLRIEAYRRLAEAASREDLEKLRSEWRDRFGLLPRPVENALLAGAIRLEAARHRIFLVEVREDKLMLTRGGHYILIGGRFPRLTAQDADSKLREILSILEKLSHP